MAIENMKITQVRYYGPNNPNNYCRLCSGRDLRQGLTSNNNAILSQLGLIYKIGIQTMPGINFYLTPASNIEEINGISVGYTGVYELDYTISNVGISTLYFDEKSIKLIDENPNAYLLIDLAYVPN